MSVVSIVNDWPQLIMHATRNTLLLQSVIFLLNPLIVKDISHTDLSYSTYSRLPPGKISGRLHMANRRRPSHRKPVSMSLCTQFKRYLKVRMSFKHGNPSSVQYVYKVYFYVTTTPLTNITEMTLSAEQPLHAGARIYKYLIITRLRRWQPRLNVNFIVHYITMWITDHFKSEQFLKIFYLHTYLPIYALLILVSFVLRLIVFHILRRTIRWNVNFHSLLTSSSSMMLSSGT